MGRVKDLTGKRFGMLTVLRLAYVLNKHTYWTCKCDCGAIKDIRGDTLKSNTGRPVTVSCGCYNRNKVPAGYIDNRTKTKLYHVYYGILQRCNNPKSNGYEWYGERGIKCLFKDWEHFKSWALTSGYKEGLTIDRIDVNGNYTPENCRWVTIQEQSQNKRQPKTAHLVWYQGKQVNLMQLSKITGERYANLYYRYTHNKPLFSKV